LISTYTAGLPTLFFPVALCQYVILGDINPNIKMVKFFLLLDSDEQLFEYRTANAKK